MTKFLYHLYKNDIKQFLLCEETIQKYNRMEQNYYRDVKPSFNKNSFVFLFILVTSKVTVSLLKSEICCNLFPHSKYIFTHVHTFASLSLDSLREHTELSIEFHETWTEFCREEEAAGPRAHAGSRPGGRQAGSGWVSHKEASGRKRSTLLRNPSMLLLLTH